MLVNEAEQKAKTVGSYFCNMMVFHDDQGTFFFFFAPAQPQRLLQLQLEGVKIQCGLCSFSEKVNGVLTNGKMLHILPGRSLGGVFVPWGTYPFCLYQWPL